MTQSAQPTMDILTERSFKNDVKQESGMISKSTNYRAVSRI